jgi:hypothetical protein
MLKILVLTSTYSNIKKILVGAKDSNKCPKEHNKLKRA